VRRKPPARKPKTAPVVQQDWAVRREAAQLERWAQTLLGGVKYSDALPYEHIRTLPEMWLGDQERWAIAHYLHSLAQQPRALEKVLKARQLRASKQKIGRPAKASRDWNIAFDYYLTRKRHRRVKKALTEVIEEWKVSRTVIEDALKKYERHPGWRDWASYELRSARAADRTLRGSDLGLKICQKMRNPGKPG
jgi:hypothetical protein